MFALLFIPYYLVSDSTWMEFWRIFVLVNIGLAVITIVWFAIGGFNDLKVMFRRLNSMKRDDTDDGFVRTEDNPHDSPETLP